LVGLLGLAGCGSDDSSISKQEYDQQLALVCNKGLQAREELVEKVGREFQEQGGKLTDADAEENLLKLIAVYQETTEEIADIGVPEKDAQKAEELVQAREDAAAKVKADPRGTRESIVTIFANASKIAKELDAKSCAT